jgi:hypothetical protein
MLDQSPTPVGQALMGGQQQQAPPQQDPQQVGSTPLSARMAQFQGQQQQPQQQAPPQPSPQQVATAQKHQQLGKVASFLFGHQTDEAGNAVKQPPGQLFRSLLAGALLGVAAGSSAPAGGGKLGGALSGLGHGFAGVEQQNYQRQQDAQKQQREQQAANLEQDKFKEEKTMHASALEHWNMENLAHEREADLKDREQLEKENEQELNIQKWAVENGAFIAPTVPFNGKPNNGLDMMRAMTKNPDAFNPPAGMGRLVVKQYNFNGLDHDAKNGWTENGQPVDWSKHLTWTVYYSPSSSATKTDISMSAKEWTELYGVKFPKDTDPNRTFSIKGVAPLISVATQGRKQQREDDSQTFKEKHDALTATISAARSNITQLGSERRQLIGQGYSAADAEVREIDDKIKDEQKREQDAIGEMHPKVRARVKNQQAPTPAAKPASNQAGPSQAFSVGAWKKANPNGDVNAAKAEAKKQGLTVVD